MSPYLVILRPLTMEDAGELTALVVEHREFLAPFEPVRDERFFTIDGQRRGSRTTDHGHFAILAGDRIAGTVTLSNIVYGAFQSANLAYCVAKRLGGRQVAGEWCDHVLFQRTAELGGKGATGLN